MEWELICFAAYMLGLWMLYDWREEIDGESWFQWACYLLWPLAMGCGFLIVVTERMRRP